MVYRVKHLTLDLSQPKPIGIDGRIVEVLETVLDRARDKVAHLTVLVETK